MSFILESIFSKETVNQINKYLAKIQKQTANLWNTSKYFRIISVATTSLTASLIARNLYVTYYRQYYNMPKGPKGLPFIGSAAAFRDPTLFKTLAPLDEYGPVATIQLGSMSCITISNPYLCRKIYSDPRTLDNPDFSVGDTFLTTANGESWAKRRKIIFANIMSTMKASFVEDSTKNFITQKIFSVCDANIKNNENMDLKKLFRAIGFNIVLHACFGKELDSLDDAFWKAYDNKLSEYQSPKNQAMRTLFSVLPMSVGQGLAKLFGMKSVEWGFIIKEINGIIEEFAVSDKHKVPVKYDENVKLYNDYVKDYLSKDDNQLTKQHLLADMSIMIQASTDTTYMGLAFAVLQAAKNPDIQEKLYQELKNAFGDTGINNLQLTHGGILKIPTLRAFVHEVLRIHSPATVAGFRQINVEDFTIDTRKYGGDKVYNVPKGCNIMMNIMAMSHEPKWWLKNYDPVNNEKHKNIDMNEIHCDFWIDANGKFDKRQNSDLFLIFSRGKRDCVGQSLAMKVIYIVVAMILMKYKVYGPNGASDFEIKQTTADGITIEPKTVQLEAR